MSSFTASRLAKIITVQAWQNLSTAVAYWKPRHYLELVLGRQGLDALKQSTDGTCIDTDVVGQTWLRYSVAPQISIHCEDDSRTRKHISQIIKRQSHQLQSCIQKCTHKNLEMN